MRPASPASPRAGSGSGRSPAADRPARRLLALTIGLLAAAAAGCTGSAADAGPDEDAHERFCSRVEALERDLTALEEVPSDLEELTAARDALDSLIERARAVEDVAPDEVAGEVHDLVEATVALASDLRDLYQQLVDDPDRATDRELLRDFQPLSEERQAEIERASAAVSPFLHRTCGIGEDGTPRSPPEPPPTR